MSGVYIKGMQMPKDRPLIIKINRDGTVNSTFRNDYRKYEAVPVPDHGRLIDADKMLADNEIFYNQLGRSEGEVGARYRSVKASIRLAPTVLPADKEAPK